MYGEALTRTRLLVREDIQDIGQEKHRKQKSTGPMGRVGVWGGEQQLQIFVLIQFSKPALFTNRDGYFSKAILVIAY